MRQTDRIIGKYIGSQPGPMLLVIGAMHGNEPAGVESIRMLFRELALEPHHNPGFRVKGSILGVIGNLKSYQNDVRYTSKDLNRSWTADNVARALDPSAEQTDETLEIGQLLKVVKAHVRDVEPTEIIVLDIHTTSSKGGIFSIASHDRKSLELAQTMHAPVVKDMLNGLNGTSIHFFRGENMGIKTTALTFEAGQHNDILSPGRAYAAIVNCLKAIGCVREEDVENRHDKVLIEFSKNLPKITKLVYKYPIENGTDFRMEPGFVSFDQVSKGQLLAYNNGQKVLSPEDGLILMPLYQKQGEEGFFIVRSDDERISNQ